MRAGRRDQFITKLVHYNYNPDAGCPLFLSVIARLMGNHPGASEPELDRAERMVGYLQRALVYSLTGTTEEKAVLVPCSRLSCTCWRRLRAAPGGHADGAAGKQ